MVLATVDRPERLPALLHGLAGQLGPHDDVWVIDQSSGEAARSGEAAVAELGHPRVRWEARARRGLPGARNQGISRSSGEVVWFVDDDVHLHPGCLQAHRSAYDDPVVGGVAGRIVEKVLVNNATTLCNRVGRSGRVHTNLDVPQAGWVDSLKGANMSLRRLALQQAGPFDEGYRGTAFLEDADLSERVVRRGWRLRYVPEAAVDHDHAPTGGVRVGSDRAREGWRFHHTGRFVRRHRPLVGMLPVAATFAAIACRQGLAQRAPLRPAWLMGQLIRGWRGGSALDSGRA